MSFRPFILHHRQRTNWDQVTHVRLKTQVADSAGCQQILDHILSLADGNRVAALEAVLQGFPCVRASIGHLKSSLGDLRHMANLREAGENSKDKGLLELGILEPDAHMNYFPDEINRDLFYEGAKKLVSVNKYERNVEARKICLEHWGTVCAVCEFDFEKVYGGRGAGFIHVHHITPIATVGHQYQLDPINDLHPVCPNCHAMIHRFEPMATIDELRSLVADMREGS